MSFRPEPSWSLCTDVGSANVRRTDGLWNVRRSACRGHGTYCDAPYGRIAGIFWDNDRQPVKSRLQRLQPLIAPIFGGHISIPRR
ncbi:MAG: hypothetical protein ACKO9Q_00835, partial [Pirellula sp.]